MVVKGINIIHEEMLKILKLIHEICEKEGLQYFIDGGSNIGAIRHKGFIPWDDDIDISMLKADYLKLIEILRKDDRFVFYFDDFTHHCCCFVFLKSTWWQASTNKFFPHLYPIKLDIRPLNVIKNTEDEIKKNLLYRKTAEYLIFNKYDSSDFDSIKAIIEDFGGSDKFLNFYNCEYGLENFDEDVKLSHPYLSYSKKTVMDKDLFFPLKKIMFENIESYIPEDDKNLRLLYGNYMELPPVEERNSYSCALYQVKEDKVSKIINLYKARINNRLSLFGKISYRMSMFLYSKLYK
ncbi:MAG: LicD family protein [Erysipelotrichaceae bacterium]|nr:LicD family protein [Erysipelotrichaceae bacterium]